MEKEVKSNLWQAMTLLGQLGYVIAIPLVILAIVGRFIDSKYDTSPWFLIAGMFFALIISTFWVYKKTAEIMKDAISQENNKSTNQEIKKQDKEI